MSVPFSNPTTSLAAARRVAPRAMTQRQRLLCNLEGYGDHGATHEELSRATGIGIRQTSTRVRSLVLSGVARDSGRTRKSASGFDAIVWVRHVGPVLENEPQTHGRVAAALERDRRETLAQLGGFSSIAPAMNYLRRKWGLEA